MTWIVVEPCIAGFGLTFISNFLVNQKVWLGLIAGIFLGHLGIKTFFSKLGEKAASTTEDNSIDAYASTLFLTLANPMTIISFAAIFAGLCLASVPGNYIAGEY